MEHDVTAREASHVWRIIDQWAARQTFPPNQAAIARHLGVARNAVAMTWSFATSASTVLLYRSNRKLREQLRVARKKKA